MDINTPGPSPWFLRTPREIFLEREVARLERALYAYKRYDEVGPPAALRFTTLIEPETVTIAAPTQVKLELAVEWECERRDIGRHIIGSWRDGKEKFGYRYFITDPQLMGLAGGVGSIASHLHEKLISEMARTER